MPTHDDPASLPTDDLTTLLLATLTGQAPDLRVPGPAYVALRLKGRRLREAWVAGADLGPHLRATGQERGLDADFLELALTRDHRPVDPAALADELPNRERGVRGVRFRLGGLEERLAPSRMIAANLGFQAAAERFCRRAGVVPAEFSRRGGRVESFAARTLLVPLDGSGPVLEPYRAGLLVPEDAVTPALTLAMAREMAAWMVRNTAADGGLPYKYWPSRGAYSDADNTIRQFMATVCLGRVAALWGEPAAADAARRNLARNLARFFEVRDGVGVISYGGSAKLGAAALAALAILEQEGTGGPHAGELGALVRGVEALWQPDGSFRTFHHPPERNDNQNFYPGEALLFLASLWRRTGDEALHGRILQSFRHHRAWHRAQRNPAFVPWHTQAYALLHRARPDPELLAFVLEMNDWLLPMQQDAAAAGGHPDLAGRFYDPAHPEYGPPHASSTGVYLEGLADALELALAEGDEARGRAYARAVAAGVRNLRQLQFKDEADMFYVGRRERVAGALRTNPYDNTIRIDNVQHGLMALLKLVRPGAGSAAG